jgi:hypothetical protein
LPDIWNLAYLVGASISVISLFILSWYVYQEVQNRRKSGKSFDGFVDRDGRVYMSVLSSIWKEKEKRENLSSKDYSQASAEGIESGIEKIVESVAKKYFEPAVYNADDDESKKKVSSSDPVDGLFESLPPSLVIETIFPSLAKIAVPGMEKLSREEMEAVYKEVLSTILREYKTIGEVTPEAGKRLLEKEVSRYTGTTISDKKEDDKEVKDSLVPEVEGNLPEDVASFFEKECQLPSYLVRGLRLSEPELMVVENRIDIFAVNEIREIMDFILKLHREGDLPFFFTRRYDIYKVFKDFLVYVGSLPFEKIFSRASSEDYIYDYFRDRARFYYTKKMVQPSYFAKLEEGLYGQAKALELRFISLISSFLLERERPSLSEEFIDFIIEKLNRKETDMISRDFVDYKRDKKGKIVDTETVHKYYDHVGFSFNDQIYLIPQAVDLWLDYYSLGMPYVLKGVIRVDFVFEKAVYVHPYEVYYTDQPGSRTFKLMETTPEAGVSSLIYRALKTKEPRIKEFRNIKTIKRISLEEE